MSRSELNTSLKYWRRAPIHMVVDKENDIYFIDIFCMDKFIYGHHLRSLGGMPRRGTKEKIRGKGFVNSFENREEIAGQQHLNSSRIETNVKGYNPKGYFKALQSHCTTFFFTNIPENHGISEMLTVFSKWGSVGDVIIPQKRDKRGNRFGFVRFKQTDQDDKLLKSLEQV
ncbi:hypothetical protein Lal_00012063 [Lupinus albus]|nr:hypothetical protein Lal_00012063 [Lupinus albus]